MLLTEFCWDDAVRIIAREGEIAPITAQEVGIAIPRQQEAWEDGIKVGYDKAAAQYDAQLSEQQARIAELERQLAQAQH
jgi:hypothetical protein